MEHVVEESDTSVYRDDLGFAGLGGMAGGSGFEETSIGVGWEFAAVEVDGELDFGLVGVAGESSRSDRERRAHCGNWQSVWKVVGKGELEMSGSSLNWS